MLAMLFERLEELGLQPEVALGVGAGIVVAAATFFIGRRWLARHPDALGPSLAYNGPPRDPFVMGSASEKRMALRRKGNTVAINLSDSEGKPIGSAVVFDRSMGGLGVWTDQGYPPGTVLRVRTVNAPPSTPWVEVEVRTSHKEGAQWQLGCSFTKSPPWGVLLMFG
jgi:hypothetical protein